MFINYFARVNVAWDVSIYL